MTAWRDVRSKQSATDRIQWLFTKNAPKVGGWYGIVGFNVPLDTL